MTHNLELNDRNTYQRGDLLAGFLQEAGEVLGSMDAVLAGLSAAPASGDKGAASAGAGGDLAPVVAAASPQASAAANPQNALGPQAAPTENTPLSRAAVCEITAQKAADLGIRRPD